MSCFPNLFIPGAAKSGTSSLHEYLNQHPNIKMSKTKEPHFFCKNRSEDELKSYLELFDNSYQYNGESSTGYMVFDGVIDRIKKNTFDIRFIFLLRNPIDRVISHYNWLNGVGCENKKLLDAFQYDMDIEPKFEIKPKGPGYKNYYQWGLYAKYLKHFYENFPSENILIITTESLHKNPQQTLNKCTDFLGLERYEFELLKKFNESVSVKNKKMYFFINYYLLNNPQLRKIAQLLPLCLKNSAKKLKEKLLNALKKDSNIMKTNDYNEEIRRKLKEYYFKDVRELKNLIASDLIEWEDFN